MLLHRLRLVGDGLLQVGALVLKLAHLHSLQSHLELDGFVLLLHAVVLARRLADLAMQVLDLQQSPRVHHQRRPCHLVDAGHGSRLDTRLRRLQLGRVISMERCHFEVKLVLDIPHLPRVSFLEVVDFLSQTRDSVLEALLVVLDSQETVQGLLEEGGLSLELLTLRHRIRARIHHLVGGPRSLIVKFLSELLQLGSELMESRGLGAVVAFEVLEHVLPIRRHLARVRLEPLSLVTQLLIPCLQAAYLECLHVRVVDLYDGLVGFLIMPRHA
mmetsp:Transcript_23081/g.55162  ORF Transcript_23081/g.55162 Transcript_23081/m.55162 type:complete len:272 (-) Transcript_23081:22-837(-)